MKLARSTWVKIGLIALLCILVCSAAGGCTRLGNRGNLFPLFPAGGVLGCMAVPVTSAISDGIVSPPDAPDAPEAPDAPDAPTVGEISAYGQGDFSVKSDLVKAIELNWLAGKVNVELAEIEDAGYDIVVTETISGNAPELDWELKQDGTLEIDYMEGSRGFWESLFTGGWQGSKELTVTIPETLVNGGKGLESFEVEAASGTYEIKGLEAQPFCGDMSFEIASGEVKVESVEVTNLEVSLASGRFDFDGSVATNASIDQASGQAHMKLTGTAPFTMKASLASGSLDITVPTGTLLRDNVSKTSGNYDNSVPTPEWGSDESCDFTLDMVSGNCVVRAAE